LDSPLILVPAFGGISLILAGSPEQHCEPNTDSETPFTEPELYN